MASSVLISGAGTAAVNGTYTVRGTFDSKPYYNRAGQPDSQTKDVVIWGFSSSWLIIDGAGSGNLRYSATEAVAFPWLVNVWDISGGDAPAPTATESPVAATAVSGATQVVGAAKLT